MKNVTITLRDDLARCARVAAARQDDSLSRFVAALLEERCKSEKPDKLARLRKFFDRHGYPGIGEALMANGKRSYFVDTIFQSIICSRKSSARPISLAGLRPAAVRIGGRPSFLFERGHATSTKIEGMTILNPFKVDPDVAFAR